MPFGSMRFINNLTGGVLFFSVILITSCKRNNPHPSEVSIIKWVESLSDKFDKSISEKRPFEIIEWEGTNVLNELNAPLFNAHPGVGFIRLKVAWQLAAVAKEQSNSAAFKSYSRHCELFAANLGLQILNLTRSINGSLKKVSAPLRSLFSLSGRANGLSLYWKILFIYESTI